MEKPDKRNQIIMMAGIGYAIVIYQYIENDNQGGVKQNEFYFDENGYPVCIYIGNYGAYKEFDSNGMNIKTTFLNANGNPMIIKEGYSTVVRHRYGQCYTEMYYDIDGNPVSLVDGQYGIKKENGKTYYLDISGKEQFNIKRTIYNESWLVILIALILMIVSLFISKKINMLLLIAYLCVVCYLTLSICFYAVWVLQSI